MAITRSDERMQIKRGISRPNRDDDHDDMDDVNTADVGSNSTGDTPDGDEDGDEKNVSATQGERPGKSYQGQDAAEASETRQKSGLMGGRGMKGSDDNIKGQRISDADEMTGPAPKVIKGRAEPKGKAVEIDGAHQGSGEGGESPGRNTMGHGEREATISGSHMGGNKD